MKAWEMRGVRWFVLHVALAAAVWFVVVGLLNGPWLSGTAFALCSVGLGFDVVERARRRRMRGHV